MANRQKSNSLYPGHDRNGTNRTEGVTRDTPSLRGTISTPIETTIEDGGNLNAFKIKLPFMSHNLLINLNPIIDENQQTEQVPSNIAQEDDTATSVDSFVTTTTTDSVANGDADISSSNNELESDNALSMNVDEKDVTSTCEAACDSDNQSSTLSPCTPSPERKAKFDYQLIIAANNESVSDADESDVFEIRTNLKCFPISQQQRHMRQTAKIRVNRRESDSSDNDANSKTALCPVMSCRMAQKVMVHAQAKRDQDCTLYQRIIAQFSFSRVTLNAQEVCLLLSARLPLPPPRLSILDSLNEIDFSGVLDFGSELSLFLEPQNPTVDKPPLSKDPLTITLERDQYTTVLLCEPRSMESDKDMYVKHETAFDTEAYGRKYPLLITITIGDIMLICIPKANVVVYRKEDKEIHSKHHYTETVSRHKSKQGTHRSSLQINVLDRPTPEEEAKTEVQFGMASTLAFSKVHNTMNIWKALSQTRCTVGLLHRDFSTSKLSTTATKPSASHSVPSASESSMPSGSANESSTIRGSLRIRNFVSLAFDAKEITALLHASDYSKVIQLIEELLPISSWDDSYIPTYFILGVAYFKLSKYQNARESFKKCKEAALKVHSDGDVMLCSAYLGDIEYSSQTYKVATEHYETAIKHYASESVAVMFKLTPPTVSAIHAKCASSFRNVAMMVEAVHGYQQAINLAQIDRDRLSAHTSLGNLYQSMGDNSNALKEYEQSIELAKRLSDHISLGWAYGNIGNAYLGLNKKDEAVFYLQKSLDIAVEFEQTPQAIGRTYNNLGTAYQSMNDLDKAEEYYDLALSQAVYGNDIAGQARVYGNIGNVHMLRKNYERAIPHYSEVLRLSTDESTVSTAQHNRGCAYYEWATSLHQSSTKSSAKVHTSTQYENKEKCKLSKSIPSSTAGSGSILSKNGASHHNKMLCHFRGCTDFRGDGSEQICGSNDVVPSANELNVAHSIHGPDCKVDICLSKIPVKAREHYQKGSEDLQDVVKYHEKRFQYIKGSQHGLTMSISLFESNSRTFHRLQDCFINLHEAGRALTVAEQSRARTLGELMLKRKGNQLKQPLTSPLSLEDITTIAQKQASPLVYFSYTGARLIGWVFIPQGEKVSMNMFEVPLSDDQFEGKSFDYYLRYSLTEKLVERSFEMYQSIVYDHESSEPVQTLFKLIAKPTLEIIEKLKNDGIQVKSCQLIIISDSYTALLPLSCLHDPENGKFLGDQYGIQVLPSFLTMGILNQLPEITIDHGNELHDFCVIGDPNIPPFVLNGEVWVLGRLPHAQREAEWVARALKTTPILGDNATKEAVLLRLSNAKIVHIATHGSASAGFLAFATFNVTIRPGSTKQANASMVLLYPQDIEKLHISPALVVLSSCDSGRGTVKADGIQGMARAFILAGAQSVLTTLWKVPDESASVFMQFFYQYLTDGLQSSLALQKSILSVRCFAKYSQYIHWSGYQLTGRDIRFLTSFSLSDSLISERLEDPTAFPRINQLKKLEKCLVKSNCLPTDVQVVKGCAGVKPSEVVTDFIHSNYKNFSAGVFWICCRHSAILTESIGLIEKILGISSILHLRLSETQQALFVFDDMIQLPQSEAFLRILKNKYVHIIVISEQYAYPDELIKEIDHKLVRGCNIHEIAPLSMIHSTQRIVYSVMKHHTFIPYNDGQRAFESLAKFSCGSPVIIDLTSQILLSYLSQTVNCPENTLHYWSLLTDGTDDHTLRTVSEEVANVVCTVIKVPQDEQDVWMTSSEYDSWDSIDRLIDACDLTAEEKVLLDCLSLFGSSPIPMFVITEISSLIATSAHKQHLSTSLHVRLFGFNFVKCHPFPVVYSPSLKSCCSHKLAYVPEYVSQCVWKSLADIDKIAAFTFTNVVVNRLHKNVIPASIEAFLIFVTCTMILEITELNLQLLGNKSYQEVYSLYLSCKRKLML